MMDAEYWKKMIWQVFVLGPYALVLLNFLFARYLSHAHLGQMLEGLKNSAEFMSEHARGIDHLRFFSRVGLLILIGRAFLLPRRRIKRGKLSIVDFQGFPRRLKLLVLANIFLFTLSGVWFFISELVLAWKKPLLMARVYGELVSLDFLLHVGPFALFAISHGVVVYITRYYLHTLIDAIGLSHPFRSEHSVILERIAFINRSQLVIGIGLAVLFKGRKMGAMNLDCFELAALPIGFKRLALLKTLCLYVGFIWLIVGGVLLILNKP